MTKEEIGSVLKELRLSCGKTQKEVAEIIGRKQQIVGHWETGYSQPDANTLFNLCDIYGTTVDEAFGFKKKDITISKDDMELLEKYHNLDGSGQKEVHHVLANEMHRTQLLREKDKRIAELEAMQNLVSTQGRIISYYQRLASAGNGQVIFEDMPVDRITIPDVSEYRRVAYAIGVNGHSMEPLYSNGDMLLIEPTCEVEIGEVGIFIVGNESYVKQLGRDELISLNKDYENISLVDGAKCMGRVVDKLDVNKIK